MAEFVMILHLLHLFLYLDASEPIFPSKAIIVGDTSALGSIYGPFVSMLQPASESS